MKRFLVFFCVFCLSMVTAAINAQELVKKKIGDLIYAEKNGEILLCGYTGKNKNLTITH